jgi:uncharacterized protein
MTSAPTVRAGVRATYTPGTTTLEPVAPGERIGGLDLLRGWAMFGVMWSNLSDWYYTTKPVTRLDHWLSFIQDWFMDGRFVSLLSILFGVGFAIQLDRATRRGADLRNTYLRRSAALLAIGAIHAFFIWHGDILMMYAIASFALLLFRDTTPRRQLAWGIFFVTCGNYLMGHLRFAIGLRYAVPMPWYGGSAATYATGTIGQIEHQRFLDVWHWWAYFGLTGYFGTVGAFLLGAWAFRSGLVERVIANRRTTLRFLGVCVAVTLFGYAVQVWGSTIWPRVRAQPESLLTLQAWNPRGIIFTALDQTDRAEGLVYAALLLLLFQTLRGKRWLAPLAAVGRMGLTTYLTQSIVCTTLFYSYGLGWFGKVGYTGMAAITVTLFAVQLAASTWWLRRFRFGPVEWMWRTLTYGHRPAMRNTAIA